MPARTQSAPAPTPSPNGACLINLKRPGSRKSMITLPTGQHKLQLVLGGWSHIAHTLPVMSNVITVTVR